jgi:hypothetical protein
MVDATVATTAVTLGHSSVAMSAEPRVWTKVVSWELLSAAQSDATTVGLWVHRLAVQSVGEKEQLTVAVMVAQLAGTKASSMVALWDLL